MAELFTTIYTAMSSAFGFEWIAWVGLFIAFFALITIILELDFLIGIMVTSLPLLLFAMYSAITLGSWGVAALILVLGLVLALSLYRLLFK